MDLKDFNPQQNGVRPPRPGEYTPMVCIKCGHHSSEKIPRGNIFTDLFGGPGLPKAKCPKCGKRAMVRDPRIVY